MAKTQSSEKRRRHIIYPLRLDNEEQKLLQDKAKFYNISVAQLLRDSAMGRKIIIKEQRLLRADLGRLGGLFKLAITKDYLAPHRPEFMQLLELIKEACLKI